jgi:threonine aldolase
MYSPAFPSDQKDLVDLRSDTVTRPSEAMYEAMRVAPLGDDVLGDDPTVSALESRASELTGKEAALFVPSGTMGNQIALASHCQPGDAILIEEEAHILYYEVGGPALIAGVVSWTLPSVRGAMDPAVVESRVLKANIHTPGTTLLCVENTHNRAGGAIIPQGHLAAYRSIADLHGMKVHMDGARVFNAAVAQGLPVREIVQHVDSVNFCLSKGLRSPVGSLLCGPAPFIERARIWRKRLGGGMRQAGLLAACGLVSLSDANVARLAEDHRRAKYVASALAGLAGLSVNLESVETNMVMVDTVTPAVEWRKRLEAAGVRCFPTGPNRLRLVFHADIDDTMCDRAVEAFGGLTSSMA